MIFGIGGGEANDAVVWRSFLGPALDQCDQAQDLGGTMSADGRLARDVMLGLLKTCRKLELSFFAYFGDRLRLNTDQSRIPPLAILVARAA